MKTEQVHTLILGAGPAGLSAGYTLAKAGVRSVVVVDRETTPGGLMRSIKRGDFAVDVGRKELYNRLAKVDDFWASAIGSDYRKYSHRGGYLFKGEILEMSPKYRGFRRGMSWRMFINCCAGFIWSRANVLAGRPTNVEEYFYRTRGKLITQVASQGFQEKLTGRRWADIPLPPNTDARDDSLYTTLRGAITRAFATGEVNTYKNTWRHPAKGTGQICEVLAKGIVDAGGTLELGAKIISATATEGRVNDVVAELTSGLVRYVPEHIVSSVPLEVMTGLLGRTVPREYTVANGPRSRKRTVILVYLFMNAPANFPHAWLQVTCPTTKIGRITNYSGFNSDMVPADKGCLCCEYYCYGADPLLDLNDHDLVSLTRDFVESTELIGRGSVFDTLVLKLPGADASQNRHNWMTAMRLGVLEQVAPFKNFYHVARTDLDIATLAGIEAAEAILSGERTVFDFHFDPEQIGIRSEPKAFEFKLPVSTPSAS